MKTPFRWKPLPFLLCGLAALTATHAGPGHDHGPAMSAAGPSGPVFLTDSQRRNLGLKTIEAEIVEPVEVEVIPETKKQPVKAHVDKIAQAFEAMAKEI